jgi:hypothetical protein
MVKCSLSVKEILWLWNSMIHYQVHNIPPIVLNLSQMNPVNANLPCSFNTHFNFSLLHTTRSSKWPDSFRFLQTNREYISLFPHAFLCPAHLILLNLMTAITVCSLANIITSNSFRVYATCTGMSVLLTAFRHESDSNFQVRSLSIFENMYKRGKTKTKTKNYTLSTTATKHTHQLKTG